MKQLRLRHLVLGGLLLFMLLTAVLLFVTSFRSFEDEALNDLREQLRYAAGSLAGNIEWAQARGADDASGHLVAQEIPRQDLRLAAYVDPEGLMAHATDLRMQGRSVSRLPGLDGLRVERVLRSQVGEVYFDARDEVLWALYPVRVPPRPGKVRAPRPGLVVMQFETAGLRALAVQRALQFGVLLLLPFGILALGSAYVVRRTLTDRIEQLLLFARSQARGQRGPAMPIQGRDELGLLGAELATLMRQLVDSRDHHVLLLDRIPNPIWRTDVTGECEFFNAAWTAFAGTEPRNWWEAAHPDDLQRVRGHFRSAWAARVPFQTELRLRFHDGSYRAVQVFAEAVVGARGDFHGYLGSCFDRQQEYLAQARLASSEARFRGLVEHTMVAVYVVQGDRLTYSNPFLADLLGYTQSELQGRRVRELIAPEDLEAVEFRMEERYAGVPMVPHEFRLLSRDGLRIPVEAFGSRIELDGAPALIGMATDISERSAARVALAAAREVIEASPTVLFRWRASRQLEILYLSDNARRWAACLGARLQVGSRFAESIDPRDRTQAHRTLERAMAEGATAIRLEFRLNAVDGRELWVECLGRILRSSLGEVLRIEGLVTDISERKRAELAQRESEARFRATFEQAAAGVVHVGLDGSMQAVNGRMCEMLGYPADAFRQQSVRSLTYAADWSVTEVNMRPLLEGAVDRSNYEKRFVRSDGSLLWAYVSVALLRDAVGAPSYLIAVVEDITARKEAEAELQRLNSELEGRVSQRTAELERLNQELETFAYSVSHDLKAPLRGIDGFSHLLEEDYTAALDVQGRDYVRRIRRGVAHMGELIDDLLDYARLDRAPLCASSFDFAELVARVVEERRDEIQARGVIMHCELPSVLLQSDREGLAMSVRNLLDNALKYSATAAPPRISVQAERVGQILRVCVSDNGIGFDMRFHDRMFEIFQRLGPSDGYGGTGVGLALVRKAMHRLGGRVWAESQLGQGARFFLELPIGAEGSVVGLGERVAHTA